MMRHIMGAAALVAAAGLLAPLAAQSGDNELSQLQSELSGLQARERTLSGQATALQNEKASLDRTASNLQAKAKDLQAKNQQATREAEGLKTTLNQLKQSSANLKAEKSKLDQQNARLDRTASSLRSEKADLDREYARINGRATQAQVNAYESRRQAYNRKVEQYRQSERSYNASVRAYESRRQKLASEAQSYERLRTALNARLRALDSGYQDHRAGVTDYTRRASDYNRRQQALATSRTQLQADWKRYQSKQQSYVARQQAKKTTPVKPEKRYEWRDDAPKTKATGQKAPMSSSKPKPGTEPGSKGGSYIETRPGTGKDPHPTDKLIFRFPEKGGSGSKGGTSGTTGSTGTKRPTTDGSGVTGTKRPTTDGSGISGVRRPTAPEGGKAGGTSGTGAGGAAKAGSGSKTNRTTTVDKSRSGWITRRSEVGPYGGSDTKSPGTGDPLGGRSYGSYQFNSKQGIADQFAEKYFPDQFKGKKAGTKEFDEAWDKAVNADPKGFAKKEDEFAKKVHYDPLANKLRKDLGIDPDKRSGALREVVLSTAIQHGPDNGLTVFKNALDGKDAGKLSDKDIINAVYDERSSVSKEDPDKLKYFKKEVDKEGEQKRYARERKQALEMLEQETKANSKATP